MNLNIILNKIPLLEVIGLLDIEISNIAFDSRKITTDGLYIAVKGTATDGHQFISSAIESGAKVVVCETLPEVLVENITYIQVKDSNHALGQIASNFYGNPSEKLSLVGVTGTNGKTSVSTLLFEVFKNLGYPSALISTVEYRIVDEVLPSTHTTPDIITLNKILAQAVEKGCKYAFMEVSSHGIHQGRINGLNFKVAGFTNLTHDHLDYHKTFLE